MPLRVQLPDDLDGVFETVAGHESFDDVLRQTYPRSRGAGRAPSRRPTARSDPARAAFRSSTGAFPAIIVTPMSKLAVLGCGKMGEALVAGLLASGWRQPEDIVVTARSLGTARRAEPEARSRYRARQRRGGRRTPEVIVLAVKPQDIDPLLASVISLTSGRSRPSSRSSPRSRRPRSSLSLGDSVPVVRAMPNTPSIVHEGMAGIAPGKHADDDPSEAGERRARATSAASCRCRRATSTRSRRSRVRARRTSRCLAEAMIEAGILLGLSREISTDLVIQTMLGSAKLLARRADASGGAARDGDVPRRDHDPSDPGAGAVRRARGLPQRDPGRDGTVEGTRRGTGVGPISSVGLVTVDDVAKAYDFGPQHPLRPERVILTYEHIEALGLMPTFARSPAARRRTPRSSGPTIRSTSRRSEGSTMGRYPNERASSSGWARPTTRSSRTCTARPPPCAVRRSSRPRRSLPAMSVEPSTLPGVFITRAGARRRGSASTTIRRWRSRAVLGPRPRLTSDVRRRRRPPRRWGAVDLLRRSARSDACRSTNRAGICTRARASKMRSAAGDAVGTSANIPLLPFTGNDDYLWALERGRARAHGGLPARPRSSRNWVPTPTTGILSPMLGLTMRAYPTMASILHGRRSTTLPTAAGWRRAVAVIRPTTVVPKVWTIHFAEMVGRPDAIPEAWLDDVSPEDVSRPNRSEIERSVSKVLEACVPRLESLASV